MNIKVLSFNGYKERLNFSSAIEDRKRVFLKMLESVKDKNNLDIFKEKLLYLLSSGGKQEINNSGITLNSIIYGMSDIEFAILRSIYDGDYSLLGFEKLSETEQNGFLVKCTEIFDVEGKLSTNAYISYCRRKIEKYHINNFGD